MRGNKVSHLGIQNWGFISSQFCFNTYGSAQYADLAFGESGTGTAPSAGEGRRESQSQRTQGSEENVLWIPENLPVPRVLDSLFFKPAWIDIFIYS